MLKRVLFLLIFIFPAVVHLAYPAEQGEKQKEKELTLVQCIKIALINNTAIHDAFLDRDVQKFNLLVEERNWTPQVTVNATAQHSAEFSSSKPASDQTGVNAVTTQRLPTGGNLSLTLERDDNFLSDPGLSPDSDLPRHKHTANNFLNFTLSQHLLKGAGITVGMASLTKARIQNETSSYNLKDRITTTIVAIIKQYRQYIEAEKQIDIVRQGIARSRDILEQNKEKLAMGRVAPNDLLEAEANIARGEVDLMESENRLDRQRIDLLKQLNLNKDTRFLPVSPYPPDPLVITYDEALNIALENRPDYLSMQSEKQARELDVIVAKSNMLWQLDFAGKVGSSYQQSSVSTDQTGWLGNWSMGLAFSAPLTDMNLKQQYVNARIAMDRHNTNLIKLRDDIALEVQDQLRSLDMNYRRLKLAVNATRLTKLAYNSMLEKLKAGRASSFDLVIADDRLRTTQLSELSAVIVYLNTITDLEKTMGVTLEHWSITINDKNVNEEFRRYLSEK